MLPGRKLPKTHFRLTGLILYKQGELSEHLKRLRSTSAYRWFKTRKVKAFYNSVAAPTFRIGVQVLVQVNLHQTCNVTVIAVLCLFAILLLINAERKMVRCRKFRNLK